MPGTALVLSGGGAKGAFQFAAERYAREVKGYKWDIIAGVSVGALNGEMLAMEKYKRLAEIWDTITNDKVYKGNLNFWSAIKILFGSDSIYSNAPLWELGQKEVTPPDAQKIKAELLIGTVSLFSGEYIVAKKTDSDLAKMVFASTIMPVIWTPINISADRKGMVDGGVRNVSPLGDVVDLDPQEVVIINCSSREPEPFQEKKFGNALDIAKRTLEVIINEFFINDLDQFLRINEMVKQAKAGGVTLRKPNGAEFKNFKCKVIEPDEPLGDTLDFSQEAVQKRIKLGEKKAKEELG